MRVIKLLALVMIYLIISLIFFSAFVFATIYEAEVYGQDEIPEVIRSDDNLVVNTTSVMPCSVKANFTGDVYVPMTCIGTPLICTYTYGVSGATDRIPISVKEDISGNTQNLYAYVDNLAPFINSFTATSLGNSVRGTYSITERGSYTKCSGIERVELYIDGVLANTKNHTKGVCLVTGSITGTKPGFVGSVNTSLKVYDYIGFFDNKTGPSVSIDASNPVIKETVKVLKAGTNKEVAWVATNLTFVRDVDVKIEIEDDLISSTNSVFANFTNFDKINTQDQSNIGANCVGDGWTSNTYNCTFSNVKLCPADINPSFFVRAIDQLGNRANAALTASFTEVTGVGEVIRLGPEPYRCIQEGNVCYVRAGINNITAEITPGSSYLDNNIFIQGVRVDCNEATNWVCQADVELNIGDTIIELIGTDDFGNPITNQTDIVVDNQVPEKIGELTSEPECPKSGETLEIRLNVNEAESPGVIISANTSEISEDNKTMRECEEVDSNEWECVLSISNIKDQEINTELEVIVEDFAGNEIIEIINVSICVEIGEIPNLISEVKTKPPLPRIDRKTASKITLNMPVPLEIVKRIEGIEIIDRSLVDCSDTPGLAGQEYMINDYGFNPVLILPLRYDYSSQEEWDDDDKIEVNCTFEFNIKHGNKRYREPEVENISFELGVYNLALGNISENYNKKIDEIKQEIRRLDKQIEKYQKVYNMLGKWCRLAETIGNLNRILQSFKSAMWLVCAAINLIIPGLGEAIWNPIHGALSGVHNLVETSIWPTGWVPVGGNTMGLIIKGACSIYTCKFYDFNTFVDIGISYAAYYATTEDRKIAERQCDDEECITVYKDGTIEQVDKETGERQIYNPETGEVKVYNNNNNLIQKVSGDGRATTYYDENGNFIYTKQYNEDNTYTIQDAYGNTFTFDRNGNWIGGQPLEQIPIVIDTTPPSAIQTPTPQQEIQAPTETTKKPPSKPTVAPQFNSLSEWKSQVIDPVIGTTVGDTAIASSNIIKNKYTQLNYVLNTIQLPPAGGGGGGTGDVILSDSITGRGIINMPRGQPFIQTMDGRVQDAVDAFIGEGSWIYNPYKSKHYDDLCSPAILFNDKKERQILCKYLGCIQEMAETGGPLEACEFDYNLGMCLYIDSAQYKLQGGATFFKVLDNIRRAFFTNILGITITTTYLFVFPGCVHYQQPGGFTLDSGTLLQGVRAVACGLVGSALSAREIAAFIENDFNPLYASNVPTELPASAPDFCQGVDYQEEVGYVY